MQLYCGYAVMHPLSLGTKLLSNPATLSLLGRSLPRDQVRETAHLQWHGKVWRHLATQPTKHNGQCQHTAAITTHLSVFR